MMSFNRTFMELKVVRLRRRGATMGMFQSHLYGIERTTKTATKNRMTSFNRTFMELKV